jgi:hypothetical protein
LVISELIGDDHYDEGEKSIESESDSSSQVSPPRDSSMFQSPVRDSMTAGRRSIFEPRADTLQSGAPTYASSFVSLSTTHGYVATSDIKAKLSEAHEIRQRRRSSLMIENPVRRSLSALPPATVRTPSGRLRSSFAVGNSQQSELSLSPTNTTKLLPPIRQSKDIDL